jgi:antitoxin VapB
MKTAKLIRSGQSQTVQLPAEFQFEGEEVYIRRDPESGDVILSAQAEPKRLSWEEYFAEAARLRAEAPEEFEDFLEDRPMNTPHERDPFA